MRGVHTKITAEYLTQWCVLINKNGSHIKQNPQQRSNEVFFLSQSYWMCVVKEQIT